MATSELASEQACADTLRVGVATLLRQQVPGASSGTSYRGFLASSRCGLDLNSRMKSRNRAKAAKALSLLLALLAFSDCCLCNCQERTRYYDF